MNKLDSLLIGIPTDLARQIKEEIITECNQKVIEAAIESIESMNFEIPLPGALDYAAAYSDGYEAAIDTALGHLRNDTPRTDAAKQSQLDEEKVRRLLQEVMGCHADPADAFYNECDKGLCGWCEQAADILAKLGENHE